MRLNGSAQARKCAGRFWMVPSALVKLGSARSAILVVPIQVGRGAVENRGCLHDVIVKKRIKSTPKGVDAEERDDALLTVIKVE